MAGEAVRIRNVISAEGTMQVRRTVLGTEEEEVGKIEIRPFVTEPAWVKVSRGATINLGNYESARLEVSISIPCYREEVIPVLRQTAQVTDELIDEQAQLLHQKFFKKSEEGSV